MKRRISWLVAATTSAVVLAFVVPLCLLVQTVARDRAVAVGNEEARAVAILVSGIERRSALVELIGQTNDRSPAETSVLFPDGVVVGSSGRVLREDPLVQRGLAGEAINATNELGGSVIVIPVLTQQGTSVVHTVVDRTQLRSGVDQAWGSIALLGMALLAMSLLVADWIGRRISTPITQLADVAQRLHEGDLEARATLQGPPETVELAETLNRLAARIVELLESERAAVGDLSHRLRTPVTALRLDAEAVEDRELRRRIGDHIGQVQRTIDAIVIDARRPLRGNLSNVCDAAQAVARRASFWQALAEDQERPVSIQITPHAAPVALADADVSDLVDVLIDNVFAHTPPVAGLEVTVSIVGPRVMIEVGDRGAGLSSRSVDAERREGTTGLGLQIARRLCNSVGGHLTLVERNPGLGVQVDLPVAQD